MLFCDHIMSIEDFKILSTSDSDLHVKVKKSLLIFHDYYYYFYSYHESGFLNHIYIKVNRLFTPVKKFKWKRGLSKLSAIIRSKPTKETKEEAVK